MDVRVGLWRRLSAKELMLLNCGVGEDSWESLGLQGDPTSPLWKRSSLGFLWKEWRLSWNSSTLATSCKELTHWKRLWCWEGLGAGGERDDRGWDGWMASLTWWTWVWVNSGSWWWTRRPGMLRFMGSQRVGHDWATELNWTELSAQVHLLKNWFSPAESIDLFQNLVGLPCNMLVRLNRVDTQSPSSTMNLCSTIGSPKWCGQNKGFLLAQIAITKYHRLSGLNNRILFSHCSGG